MCVLLMHLFYLMNPKRVKKMKNDQIGLKVEALKLESIIKSEIEPILLIGRAWASFCAC